jgi:S1-C subfamily serine protease
MASIAFTQATRGETIPPELSGASPGERSAIQALCGSNRPGSVQSMCDSNQMALLQRLGRKPDLSVASSAQRSIIVAACSNKTIPGERFGCERAQLSALKLPVRDEPGGGQVHAELAAAGTLSMPQRILKYDQKAEVPFFSLEKWRLERPAMPPARPGDALASSTLYQKISPSIYVVMASEHALELVGRTEYSQGSAVAVTDRILITNCHVVSGRPQISISQNGQTSRATLVYADSAGDRCFLKSDSMPVNPVQGIRRFEDIRVGETVFSLGTPVGLELSFADGLVSGLRQFEGVHIVQNSAPTWHGSSGGGLFDTRGNLVGITTAISTNIPNLNFSIAASDFWP